MLCLQSTIRLRKSDLRLFAVGKAQAQACSLANAHGPLDRGRLPLLHVSICLCRASAVLLRCHERLSQCHGSEALAPIAAAPARPPACDLHLILDVHCSLCPAFSELVRVGLERKLKKSCALLPVWQMRRQEKHDRFRLMCSTA